MISNYIILGIVCVLLVVFLLTAVEDIGMLFRRPVKTMGTGLSRVHAVAHTTLLEAWAGRAWLLPVLWFIAATVLCLAVRPFDESERIPLYIRMMLLSQEVLLLVMIGIMACISLPRERERKIIISNASKPLSRLEILLGKIVGFSAAAFGLLMVMGLASWIMLMGADQWMRSVALRQYNLAQEDYKTKVSKNEQATPAPIEKKELAENGSLFAYNYITVPENGMSIVGKVDRDAARTRYIKGGSEERIIYRFSTVFPVKDVDVLPVGQRPYFSFFFPPEWMDPNNRPMRVELNVMVAPEGQPLNYQQKTISLNLAPDPRNPEQLYHASWAPEHPLEIFGTPEAPRGPFLVTVTCPTPGVFLRILEGQALSQNTDFRTFGVMAIDPRNQGILAVPDPKPVVRGFERYDKQQVAGPTEAELYYFTQIGREPPAEVAVFRFPGPELRKIPVEKGEFKLHLVMDVDKEKRNAEDTEAVIEVYNENAPTETHRARVRVVEKRLTAVTVPESFLGGPDPSKRGDMVVLVSCQTPGHWLAMNINSLRVEEPPSPFVFNLLKSELVILAEAVLLVTICVSASVRLGWPVAMLVALTCYILGMLREFIGGILEMGGMGALGFMNYGEPSAGYRIYDVILASVWKLLYFIIFLLPDFTRFDYVTSITQLRNISMLTVLYNGGWAVLYALPFIAIGYMLFKKQELG